MSKSLKSSRRVFVKSAALGIGATSLVSSAQSPEKQNLNELSPAAEGSNKDVDFTKFSAALEPDKTVRSACQFCNSLCGLVVNLKAGRVVGVQGEANDPVQNGDLCVKAEMMTELVYSPHRLKTPMKRVSGAKGSRNSTFEAITWEEALDLISRRFLRLRDEGDARSIANKTSGRLLRGVDSVVKRFFELIGSPNSTDVGPVCNDAGGNALSWTLGLGNFTNGYGIDESTGREDLGSADFHLFLGTNQAETHPVTFSHLLRERKKRKARLVVIDPRLTPTGAQADEWLAPKPHTDLALVLGMLHHIITNGLHDKAFVSQWVLGFEELRSHLISNGYTLDWSAGITGVPANKLRRVAEQYSQANRATIFCNAGISHQLSAFHTYRALTFLAAITGNIGKPGSGCNFMHNTWPGQLNLPTLKHPTPTRVPALPVGPDWFAESILEGRPYQLRALVTEGNPIIGSANTTRVRKALETLEFYVYTGLFMEEAAYYADVILPVCSGFEMKGVYMRRDDRAIRWQHAAVPPVGESRTDIEIWIDLAARMGQLDKQNSPDYWTANLPSEWKDFDALWAEFINNTPGTEGMTRQRLEARSTPLQWPCPDEKHPGVSTLYLDHPSWYRAAERLDSNHRGKRFLTPSGKVEIYTRDIEEKLATAGHQALPIFYTHPHVTGNHPTIQYENKFVTNPVNPSALTPKATVKPPTTKTEFAHYPLMGTIGRSSVVHFSGVTHWTRLGKQLNGIRLIQIHPDAAKKSGLTDGDGVIVESPNGIIRGKVLLWKDIRPDTVFIPNSFAEGQIVGDEVGAARHEPANVLVGDQYFDNLSGQQAYKCFACRLRRT